MKIGGSPARKIAYACEALDFGAQPASCHREGVVHVAMRGGVKRYCLAHARRYEEQRGGAA